MNVRFILVNRTIKKSFSAKKIKIVLYGCAINTRKKAGSSKQDQVLLMLCDGVLSEEIEG